MAQDNGPGIPPAPPCSGRYFAVDPALVAPEADQGGTAPRRERKKHQTWVALHTAALDAVHERGLNGVTVEEIAEQADVSPRTFFNYFPSKAAAALGLAAPSITQEQREQFLARDEHGLVDDLCRLVATSLYVPRDRLRIKELIHQDQELHTAVFTWNARLREDLYVLAVARTEEHRARLALSLVFASLGELVRQGLEQDEPVDLHRAMVSLVREIAELATDTPRD